MEDYIEKLKSHDWFYEYSDDYSVWKRGCTQRGEILDMQQDLDLNYEIWNKYAPEHFQVNR